jgi:hypothetical protein
MSKPISIQSYANDTQNPSEPFDAADVYEAVADDKLELQPFEIDKMYQNETANFITNKMSILRNYTLTLID